MKRTWLLAVIFSVFSLNFVLAQSPEFGGRIVTDDVSFEVSNNGAVLENENCRLETDANGRPVYVGCNWGSAGWQIINSRNGGSVSTSNTGGGLFPGYGSSVFNGSGVRGGADIVEANLDDSISKERDLKALIVGWTNFGLSIAALLAVIAIIWAGILYITALGDDGRMDSAKKIILWALVGLLVILIAFALVNTVIKGLF